MMRTLIVGLSAAALLSGCGFKLRQHTVVTKQVPVIAKATPKTFQGTLNRDNRFKLSEACHFKKCLVIQSVAENTRTNLANFSSYVNFKTITLEARINLLNQRQKTLLESNIILTEKETVQLNSNTLLSENKIMADAKKKLYQRLFNQVVARYHLADNA